MGLFAACAIAALVAVRSGLARRWCRAARDGVQSVSNQIAFSRRCQIETWFARGKLTSPKTGARLPHTQLTPNHNLKSAIRNFLDEVREFATET